MKELTLFEYTKDQILQLIQADINTRKNENHLVEFYQSEIPQKITVKLSMWNKDEIF